MKIIFRIQRSAACFDSADSTLSIEEDENSGKDAKAENLPQAHPLRDKGSPEDVDQRQYQRHHLRNRRRSDEGDPKIQVLQRSQEQSTRHEGM